MTQRRTARFTRDATLAQRLIASSGIAQHILDATIEITGESRDILYKPGKFGDLFLVRSLKFVTRYYPVNYRAGAWSCDAENASTYITAAQRYLAAHAVA